MPWLAIAAVAGLVVGFVLGYWVWPWLYYELVVRRSRRRGAMRQQRQVPSAAAEPLATRLMHMVRRQSVDEMPRPGQPLPPSPRDQE